MSLFTPVFTPALYNPYSFSDLAFTKLSSLFRLEQQQKTVLKIHFEFAYFSFFLSHLVLKQEIRSYTPVVPLDTIPDSIPKWSKSISVFRPKRRKNHTLWGGTYLYGFYRGLRPPPPGQQISYAILAVLSYRGQKVKFLSSDLPLYTIFFLSEK